MQGRINHMRQCRKMLVVPRFGVPLLKVKAFLSLRTHLFVKVPRPWDSEETFSVFEASCHLSLPV